MSDLNAPPSVPQPGNCAEPRSDRFCIVGAGSSGLAVAKNFLSAGIPFDCLEREDDVGGNWYYGKPHSSVYRSTRLISSKRGTEYTDYPMPANWPEHPRHELVWDYLCSYARQFDLYRHIEFNTTIASIEPVASNLTSDADNAGDESKSLSENRLPKGDSPNLLRRLRKFGAVPDDFRIGSKSTGWTVTLADGSRRLYRGVVIANGHNWAPRWPEYRGTFSGPVLHSSQYKVPEAYRGQRVLVVGGGNSGFDIATDVANHAATTFHSLRRGYHILPRFNRGTPVDESAEWALRWRVPLWFRRQRALKMREAVWAERVARHLPQPDHRLFETHPIINSRWPYAVADGAIHVKPDVDCFEGSVVRFVDGSHEEIDALVYATGYKLSFPFIDRAYLNWRDDRPELYLNIFHPHRDDLFVAGLIQPDSGQFGLVDLQAQLIAAYLEGLARELSAAKRFRHQKAKKQAALSNGIRYINSPRHLLEVEHASYRRILKRYVRRLRFG